MSEGKNKVKCPVCERSLVIIEILRNGEIRKKSGRKVVFDENDTREGFQEKYCLCGALLKINIGGQVKVLLSPSVMPAVKHMLKANSHK